MTGPVHGAIATPEFVAAYMFPVVVTQVAPEDKVGAPAQLSFVGAGSVIQILNPPVASVVE